MTEFVIVVVAAVAIGYAAWYERGIGRDERRDRDFARRHRVDAPRFDRPVRLDTDRDGRDPSPQRRLTDYEWRALADGMEQT